MEDILGAIKKDFGISLIATLFVTSKQLKKICS